MSALECVCLSNIIIDISTVMANITMIIILDDNGDKDYDTDDDDDDDDDYDTDDDDGEEDGDGDGADD
eukprot:8875772-Karenia_brevis.AAC.1